jgi:hypothetical protein
MTEGLNNGWCCVGLCVEEQWLDGDCAEDCHCVDFMKCTTGKCKKKDGQACAFPSECASGNCAGICSP